MKEKADPEFRAQAYELVLRELAAAKAARRKVLEAEMENQLRTEFDAEEARLRARWAGENAVEVGGPAAISEPATMPIPRGRVAKSLLEILFESPETALTKSLALAELTRRQVRCTDSSVLHAYGELSGLGLLEFLPPDRGRGEKRFRLANKYWPGGS